ncbi:MAG: glycosyltransferase family 4 protein [Chloroflexia bacterium]
MRIAVFIPGFQRDESDWCIPAFTNLARELAKEAQVDVFALRYPPTCLAYRIGAVRVHTIGAGTFGQARVPGISLARLWHDVLRRFDREHRKRQYDVVVSFWATESGALGCIAATRWGLPALVHLAGGELVWMPHIRYGNWRRRLSGALVETSLRTADMISAPSSYMAKLLTDRFPATDPKSVRWSLGVDTAMFTPTHDTSQFKVKPFTFITVASVLPVKGLDLILEASALIRKARPDLDFSVVIVGDGPIQHLLLAKINVLGLKGYVVLYGEVSHGEMPAVYASASCFVMTSWHEAQCMALLEAAASGLPWIATPVGVASDLSKSKQPSGIILADRKPSTLAAAMRAMMERPQEERISMGRTAREQALLHYDLRRQIRELLLLLDSLTVNHVPGRMKASTPRSVTRDVLLLMRDATLASLRYLAR